MEENGSGRQERKRAAASYNICVANSCIYRETDNSDYVYLAEEREGILGTDKPLMDGDTVKAVQ